MVLLNEDLIAPAAMQHLPAEGGFNFVFDLSTTNNFPRQKNTSFWEVAKTMKKILILGSDRIAGMAWRNLPPLKNLVVIIDDSTSLRRTAKLVFKGKLKALLVLKMLVCELRRPPRPAEFNALPKIKNNKDLLALIDNVRPSEIFLFRAGLIINKSVISQGVPLLNIHCANVPEYGGIGSIQRAIADKALQQNATLHHVTVAIDEGEVLDREPYNLNLKHSYCANENAAYEAGARLLARALG